MQVIQVAVPRPLHSVYDYRVPSPLPLPAVGARVRVPFGRHRVVAVCVANQNITSEHRLRDIEAVLDDEAAIPEELMQLAIWMCGYYHYPLGEVLATMLPAAARKGSTFAITPADFWQAQSDHFDKPRAQRQQALFEFIRQHNGADGQAISNAGFDRQLLRQLAARGMVSQTKAPPPSPAETPPDPSVDQQKALDHIAQHQTQFHSVLLDGITGSGKTEVYLRAMQPVLEAGKQVLVLVPEIALTPQTLSRFVRRFGQAGMLHSALTDAERLQTWLRCANGELPIILGTRSAVFTPFRDLGLVVVDEEHDSSYKQQDGLRYSARDIALMRAQSWQIPIILGSATPSLESLHNVARGRYHYLALRQRAGGAELPSYHTIDMRGQRQQDGISLPLEVVIRRHLAQGNQALVFLNRRGYAPSLLCAACGWQAMCPACDAKLTLHREPRGLHCHHCGYRSQVPAHCEACQAQALMPVGMGTQRSAARLTELFPDVPVYRIDRDTTRGKRALETQLATIQQGLPCILIGTQLLAKGHHFPDVTLVAVLNADAGFCSADFRAPERTAQLIVQVAGRAGRASKPGEVYIQSYQPDNPLLQRLISDGYGGFAQAELQQREKLGLPPLRPMALLRADARDPRQAEQFLQTCRDRLNTIIGDSGAVSVLGPVSAPLTRRKHRSRYQLMLLATNRTHLHSLLNRFEPPKANQLHWSIDIDPYDAY